VGIVPTLAPLRSLGSQLFSRDEAHDALIGPRLRDADVIYQMLWLPQNAGVTNRTV